MARLTKPKQGKKRLGKRSTLPTYTPTKVGTYKGEYDLVAPSKRPDHSAYPKFNPKRVPPDTYYAVERDLRKPMQLMTVMPDGLAVGWSNCGNCHGWWGLCSCPGGIVCPRSVEYIYNKTVARLAGEEWDWQHPNYKGSLTLEARRKHQERLESKGRGVAAARTVTASTQKPAKAPKKSLRRSGVASTPEAPSRPSRALRKAAVPDAAASAAITDKGVDSKAIHKAATDSQGDLEAQVLGNVMSGRKLRRRKK